MTLNKWHNRPGGKWRIGRKWSPSGLARWYWDVRFPGNIYRCGYAPFAWLARARAIAALRRMRAPQLPATGSGQGCEEDDA